MKTLCIYAAHEHSLNLDFFIKHGIVDDPSIDYYIVLNNLRMVLKTPQNVKVINRENLNGDFGAWSHVLLDKDKWQEYDYFLLLNSTIRGPFLPVWQKDSNWVPLFTNRLNETTKLVGITIGYDGYPPHVNSMLLTLDKTSMTLAIEKGIFFLNTLNYSHEQLIVQKEVGLSTLILDSGYNIGCMLKALDGIDFRQDRKVRDYSFFLRSHYNGVDVHPYETIFIKTKLQVGLYERTPYITRATLWSEETYNLDLDSFNWRAYILQHEDLWQAGLNTEEMARQHYQIHGRYEARVHHVVTTPGKFYVVDLNPRLYHGFINQIYCLLNAIIIGHFTGRSISVDGFYPNYNHPAKLPITQVIDIDRLNVLITKLGLSTTIGLNGNYCRPKHSRYKDWTIQGSPMEVFHKLREEKFHALNLGNVFFFMIQREMDPDLQKIFKQLLIGLPWSKSVQETVESIQSWLNLDQYASVHLRMEDDIIAHGGDFDPEELHKKYLISIERIMKEDPEQGLFIATNLGKCPNRYNFLIENIKKLYPNAVTSVGWRENFKELSQGREMDALVDYLLAQKGNSFTGYPSSTFSEALISYFTCKGLPALDCTQEEGFTISPFTIICSHTPHGKLGLNYNLGHTTIYHGEHTSKLPLNEDGVMTMSIHAPSMIKIRTRETMSICGYCSPTAENPPTMVFYCDNEVIGQTKITGDKTDTMLLAPGEHVLLVETSSIHWAHSVWLLKRP